MNILVDLTHPSDVHFFRQPLENWRSAGHHVDLVARDKDMLLALLAELGHECLPLGRAGRGVLGLGREMLHRRIDLFLTFDHDRLHIPIGLPRRQHQQRRSEHALKLE